MPGHVLDLDPQRKIDKIKAGIIHVKGDEIVKSP